MSWFLSKTFGRWSRSAAGAFIICCVCALGASAVAAQKRKSKRARSRGAKNAQVEKPSTQRDSAGDVRVAGKPPASAGGEVVEEGGKKVKVIRFSGLDISGKLKGPQMLYFLNRMNAEFDRPRLPHRSFVQEIERSTERRPLR